MFRTFLNALSPQARRLITEKNRSRVVTFFSLSLGRLSCVARPGARRLHRGGRPGARRRCPRIRFRCDVPLRAHAIIVCELNRSLFERPLAFTAGFFVLCTAPADPVSIPPKPLLAHALHQQGYREPVPVRHLKHVSCMSNLLGIFVLGHYGALYTQNDENDAICFLNAQFNHRAHASGALVV